MDWDGSTQIGRRFREVCNKYYSSVSPRWCPAIRLKSLEKVETFDKMCLHEATWTPPLGGGGGSIQNLSLKRFWGENLSLKHFLRDIMSLKSRVAGLDLAQLDAV